MQSLSACELAEVYWKNLRRASLHEVEMKLEQFKFATPKTLRFWLEIQSILEKKACESRLKFERSHAQ